MLSSHTVGFKRPDNSNLANLTPGLCILVGLDILLQMMYYVTIMENRIPCILDACRIFLMWK